MSLELRILSGELAGRAKHFEQPVVVIGRHGTCDMRFDADKDLDVSTRHAEIRGSEGRYVLHDMKSTNGTFVNGKQMARGGSVELKPGDRVRFGAAGPEAEIVFAPRTGAAPKPASTEVRIAMAVSRQTASLRRLVVAAIVLVLFGGAAAFYYSSRATTQRVEELNKILAANDSMRIELQATLVRSGDTTLVNQVQQRMADLRDRLARASTDADRATIRKEIRDTETQLRRMVRMDLGTIFARNARAVAIMVSEINGTSYAGSAFSITNDGVMITNRHNVRDTLGRTPTRIAVKFTNSRDWLPARVVKVSDDPDTDLALIQMERPGPYPVIEGVSATAGNAPEGLGVATIGYPAGYDTPMEGSGNDFEARATLTSGMVSKKTSSVLQIDSFATHGSSGSPIFNAQGHVIGVVYGGLASAGGKIVYAVPPERIAAFIQPQYKSIVRD
jgi:S1-C subfamily serine protease